MSGQCFLCRRTCDERCANPDCADTWYCCAEHRLLHHDQDNDGACRPFQVAHNKEVGRHLIATRDLDPGELVIKEEPIMIGNNHETPPCCLGCFKILEADDYVHCDNCNLPLCGRDRTVCSRLDLHHDLECQIFSQSDTIPSPAIVVDSSQPHPFYQCVTPLRCLLLRDKSPDKWACILAMADHEKEKDKKENPHWLEVQHNIVGYLRTTCHLDFSISEINHVIGVLEVNAFEISTDEGWRGRGVFPLTALMSHSCISNTRYNIEKTSAFRSECRTNVVVPKGTELTDHYVSPLNGTRWRRRLLKEGWYFDCSCQRCQDPTELGTMMSAHACPKCITGHVLPPLNATAGTSKPDEKAACADCCEYKVPWDSLTAIEESLSALLDDNSDRSNIKHDRTALEKVLKSHSGTLHINHFLMIAIKRYLLYLYPKDEPNRVEICKQLLDTYDVICPGLTKERGLTLFELHISIYALVQKQLANPITHEQRSQLSVAVDNCIASGKEAQLCLQYESPGTFESMVYQGLSRTLPKCERIQASLAATK